MPHAPVVRTENLAAAHAATAPATALAGEVSKVHAPSSNQRGGAETLRQFFAANPDEELTIEDAANKLGVNHKSAGSYLARLKAEGILQRISIYRAKEGT